MAKDQDPRCHHHLKDTCLGYAVTVLATIYIPHEFRLWRGPESPRAELLGFGALRKEGHLGRR